MGVVAAGAEIISPFARTCKISNPFPMDASPPVLVLVPVAFAAESITFCKVDQVPVIEPQLISILRIMAVETPPHRLGVMERDIRMLLLQHAFFAIDLHRSMAVATGIHSLGHRRGSILFNDRRRRGSQKKQQKQRGNCCVEESHDRSTAFLLGQRFLRHFYSVSPTPKI